MTISFFDLEKEKKEKVGIRLPTQPETPQGKGCKNTHCYLSVIKPDWFPSPSPLPRNMDSASFRPVELPVC